MVATISASLGYGVNEAPPLAHQMVYMSTAAGILSLFYVLARAVYNLYFHPLAGFPGPFLAKCSLIWRIVHSTKGSIHQDIDRQHCIHGPVVRVSPNELSFASVASWKDIYGHQPAGKQTFVKGEFYDMYGSGFEALCIGSERDPMKHRRMKTALSAAFSTKALLEQENIVALTVDKFVARIGTEGNPASPGINMTKWYEMIAFDVLGEMAFGESFGCVDQGKPHFWQELILDHLFFITVADNLRRFPLVRQIARVLFPFTTAIRNKHTGYTRDKVAKRLKTKSGRKDLITNLVGKVESGEIGKEEMTAHASTLVIAGGETVATFLAATTYYLLQPGSAGAYTRLCAEIRARYASYDAIDTTSAQQLPYLQAVISEGLRIYPPGAQGFPRVSPGQAVDGRWVPAGTEVYTSAWSVTRDPANFPDPATFRPERWLGPEGKGLGKGEGHDEKARDVREASQPFSLGPRGCLGRNFAMMEVNLILAKMLWKYDLELMDKELDWVGQSRVHIMWWKPDLMVRFHERRLD